jgi:hypothetical protein
MFAKSTCEVCKIEKNKYSVINAGDPDVKTPTTFSGYKVEEKLHLGAREQKKVLKLNRQGK